MKSKQENHHCINCGRSEGEAPLLEFRYQGEQRWICSGCFPVLIHRPDELAGKLEGAEDIPAAPGH
jgi:hypothetical protein